LQLIVTSSLTHSLTQVIDISNNPIPSKGIRAIAGGLRAYTHALVSLNLSRCGLDSRAIAELTAAFKSNYGMSLSIQQVCHE
jgi:Ran GTPase-activating protein (RanGAP) involved in mRNA processing and transport